MSEVPTRKPAVIRKRFPWGWLVLGLLALVVLGAGLAAAREPAAVAAGHEHLPQ